MTILIDGDILIYQASAAAEQETVWDDEVITLHSSKSAIEMLLHDAVDNIRTALGRRRKVIFTLTGRTNFRKELDPTYKAHRRGRKPLGYMGAVDLVRETWDTVSLPDLEADDVMGIMATSGRYKDPMIVTEDKDLRQIPCGYYNPRQDIYVEHDPMFHMVQTLAGDRADGYPGCPGFGDISAVKLLSDLQPEEWWPAVMRSYVKKGLAESDALLQARLAYILQSHNYNKGKIKLWEPSPVSNANGAEATPKAPATKQSKPKTAQKSASKKQSVSSTKARPSTSTQRARSTTRAAK